MKTTQRNKYNSCSAFRFLFSIQMDMWASNLLSFLLGIAFLMVGSTANATLFYWNCDTTGPTSGSDAGVASAAFTDPAANQSGTAVSLISGSSSSDYTGASGGNNFEAKTKIGGLSTSTSTYFAIILTPSAGYAITVNSISLGSRSTSTGPTLLTFYSSIDGYAAAIGSEAVSANSAWANLSSFSFSGSSLDGSVGSTVEFRIYGSGGSGTVSSANWRIDDINFNVTAVPEPAAWGTISAFGLFGIIGLRAWRQRWQNSSVTD